jgi:hypothetical protein
MPATQIKFACPNGHPLSCPREMIGKPGKCPKCEAKFVVPDVPEEEAAEGIKSDSSKEKGNGTPTPPAPNPDIIVFLCPNGHKLNGPSNLAGKAGKCPHCGAKFVIPRADEMPEEEEESEEEPAEVVRSQRMSDSAVVDPRDMEQLEEVEEFPAGEPEGVEELAPEDLLDQEEVLPPPPPGSHPLGNIFARLWRFKTQERDVQLHLQGGEILSPAMYCRDLSYKEFGVFAVSNDDGTFTVTTIPWHLVTRIAFRQISELPPSLFE